MPTRLVMGSCCRRKTVILQVYVEKPRRAIKRLSPNHHHHQTTKQQSDHIIKCKHGIPIKGYNRKVDLLHYTRRRFHEPTQSAPLIAREAVSSTKQQQQPAPKVVSVKKKPSTSKGTPTNCLGNNNVLAPKFLTSLMKSRTKKKEKTNGGGGSFGERMKAIVKHFEMQRRCSFFKKLFATMRKSKS